MDGIGPLLPFLLVGGIALLIAGIVVWGFLHERKRTEAMKAAAEQLGLPFYPTGDPRLVSDLASFDLFSQGRSKKITNMIHGESDEVEVGVFDYQYTTGSGKNSHTSKQTVVYFQSEQLKLPQFALRPEHLFHRIGGVFGYQDIDFESHAAFSSAYLLRGSDEEQLREVFGENVLAFFEKQRGVSVEGNGRRLVFYRAAKRMRPEQVRALMEEGFRVFALFRS
jgi:hypothetical protein